jgi:hypothetical protein
MVMQLQAQMALGGLGQPNQLLGNPASLGVIADPRQLLNVSNIHSPALHQQVPIREEKEISQLQKLPALSADPSPSFLSMDHRTLQRGKAEGQEHQRGFQSINENKSYAPLKGGVKKQSHAPDQGCSSMSMLDRSERCGVEEITVVDTRTGKRMVGAEEKVMGSIEPLNNGYSLYQDLEDYGVWWIARPVSFRSLLRKGVRVDGSEVEKDTEVQLYVRPSGGRLCEVCHSCRGSYMHMSRMEQEGACERGRVGVTCLTWQKKYMGISNVKN